MIITGDLTLPNGVSPQKFLSEMFDLTAIDQSPLLEIKFTKVSDARTSITSVDFPTLLYDNIDRAELVFATTSSSDMDATERLISMVVLYGTNGESMNITLIVPTTFNEFNAALAANGIEAFNALLMPQTGPGFFLDHTGSPGGDTMEGFDTGDFLKGLAGNDYINGFGGNDALSGGVGHDTLMGGTGEDALTGGAGEDVFVISPNEDKIEVLDLMPIEDRVDFTNFLREDALIEAVLNSPTGFVIDGTEVLFYDGNGGLIRLPVENVILPDLRGSDQSEALLGSEAAEAILGLVGDDTIEGGGGNDTINGGSGEDTAVYGGNQSNYTVFIDPMSIEIQDRLSKEEYQDVLDSIEFLDFETELDIFSDALFDLRLFSGAADLEVDEFAQIIELYIAYLGRAPDAIGLLFWATAFEEGATLEELAVLFADEAEPQAALPDSLSNEAFVEKVYDQVLGRAPDADGAQFWLDQLDKQSVDRDAFILELLRGAKADAPDGASQEFSDQQSADRDFLGHKTDIGADFGIKKGMSDVGNAISAMDLFDGTQSGLDAAFAAINQFYADALGPEGGEFLIQLTGMSAADFTD
ncbi:MAG: DUF4214 domain-containing protein [Sulfitobacter sp.]